MRNLKFVAILWGVFCFVGMVSRTAAQTPTSGDITGVVTDPSGAVVPSAQVQLKDLAHGNVQTATTNTSGAYRFSLLPSGQYEISVNSQGFQQQTIRTAVQATQVTTVDIRLALSTASTTLEVVEELPLVQSQTGNLDATLTETTVQNMPNPGNDLTYTVQVTPGALMNTSSGYGNVTVNGVSATSNLFTLDGMDDNDPYLSLNDSGATNLLLGLNEVQEVTVVTNGYGGQFGGLAGSNVNYVTRSGTDAFHGKATYFWNGTSFNANSFFNNLNGTPKSFVNANQYGGAFGGPLIKDKLFFYFDTEGLRLVIPTSTAVTIPTPAFEAATLTNLAAIGDSASIPFYTTMFNLYNGAPGASRAVLGSTSGSPGCTGGPTGSFSIPGVPDCVENFRSNINNHTGEAIYAGRLDYNVGTNDRLWGRIQTDHGHQASFTDPINQIFDLVSDQPEWQGQIWETHAFGATATNQFVLSGQWYAAPFSAPNLNTALSAFPTSLILADGSLTNLAPTDTLAPQGRNVTQVQASDDFSKTMGRHSLKFGIKYRRNDVTDGIYGVNTSGTMAALTLNAFYNGGFNPADTGAASVPLTSDFSVYSQAFPTAGEQRFTFYTLGGYAQDDLQVKDNLTLTFSLRLDHPYNPTCKANCFARLVEGFPQLISDPALSSPSVPYNQIIELNQSAALPSLQKIEAAPRFGFAWQPFGRNHTTVIRGGIGIFYDAFPGNVVDNFSENPPLFSTFTVGTQATPLAISPAQPGNAISTAVASNAAFQAGFNSGATLASLQASVPGFVPPAYNFANGKTDVPQYQKWSLQLEQGFGANTSLTIGYAGNHGIHEVVQNAGFNAFAPGGFTGLPTTVPDSRFGFVNGIFAEGVSDYNGLTVSVTHRYSSGSISANYTYSHALDEISNGGLIPYAFQSFGSTDTSAIYQGNPNNLRQMYGNADYDVRHSFNLNYVWELPFKRLTFGHGPDALLKGWQVAGTLLTRSGLPWTALDMTTTGALEGTNYALVNSPSTPTAYVFANLTGAPGSCSGPGNNVAAPCINTAAFTTSPAGFGNEGRNVLRGPGYFDTDFSIMKLTHIPRWERGEFGIGFQFYNILNHPNFDNPINNVASTTFGTITRTIYPPTTPYGSGLGADASPRLIQAKLQFSF